MLYDKKQPTLADKIIDQEEERKKEEIKNKKKRKVRRKKVKDKSPKLKVGVKTNKKKEK